MNTNTAAGNQGILRSEENSQLADVSAAAYGGVTLIRGGLWSVLDDKVLAALPVTHPWTEQTLSIQSGS